MIDTIVGAPISEKMLDNYLSSLVNHFFKILPIRESGEESLGTYMESLQVELLGSKNLIVALKDDPDIITLSSILQYLIDHPECSVKTVKREVFKAIRICNNIKRRHVEVVD